jgi:hypothetical protein
VSEIHELCHKAVGLIDKALQALNEKIYVEQDELSNLVHCIDKLQGTIQREDERLAQQVLKVE